MLINFVPGFAKTTPYPPCTVTAFWLKYQDRDRMLRRVTQPPHIAGPLGQADRTPTILMTISIITNKLISCSIYNNLCHLTKFIPDNEPFNNSFPRFKPAYIILTPFSNYYRLLYLLYRQFRLILFQHRNNAERN